MRTDAVADSGSRRKLPTGLVTFLFTDIEDSSGLVQRLGDDYRRVLAIHDRLLRAAIADHGGMHRASREQGGVMASAAGIVDPLDAARHAGVGEAVIAAESAAGEALDIAGAVNLALQLLGESAGEGQFNSRN